MSQTVDKSTLYLQSAHVLTQVSMSACEAGIALTCLHDKEITIPGNEVENKSEQKSR